MGNSVPKVAYASNSGNGSLWSKLVGTATLLTAGVLASAGNQDTQIDQAYSNQATQESTPSMVIDHRNLNSRSFPSILGGNMYQGLEQISKMLPQKDYGQELSQINGFGQRQDYIRNLLQTTNPQLLPSILNSSQSTALAEFNRKHNMNLTCLGIKRLTTQERDGFGSKTVVTGQELVFVDMDYLTGRNTTPTRIGINFVDIAATQGKSNVLGLLERKLDEHKQSMRAQHAIWAQPYEFSFAPNQGACMLVLEQYPLQGMETDLVSSLRAYTGRYGMSVNAIGVGNYHSTRLQSLLENEKDLPAFTEATREAILTNLEKSLQKAIDDGKTYFVFHYFLHGSPDGKIHAENGAINPQDLAEVISRPYGRQNRPLCEQIDIFMWAASCYSGQQINGIRSYFENNRHIPVRNLRIIAEADNTSSWVQGPDAMSLATSLPIMADTSGITDFYSAVFDEYQNELANRGVRIEDRARSYLWKVRFIDLMSRFDSGESQDLQGFHFSNNPNYNRIFEHQFSQLEPRITENPDSQSQYAQLENLKDVTPGIRWNEYLATLREQNGIA